MLPQADLFPHLTSPLVVLQLSSEVTEIIIIIIIILIISQVMEKLDDFRPVIWTHNGIPKPESEYWFHIRYVIQL